MSRGPAIAAALERAWRTRRGSPDERRAAMDEAVAAAGGDPEARGPLEVLRAQVARAAGDLAAAWDHVERATDLDPRWQVRALALRGSLQFERESPRASADTLRAALEALLLDREAAPLDVALVRNDLGRALFHEDELAEADDLFADAADAMARAGDHRALGVALTNRASVRSVLGDLEGALALYREALATSDEPRSIALAWANLAVVHERLGDADLAVHACGQALELSVDPPIRVTAAAQLAHLLMDRGDRDEAREVLAAARADAEGLSPAHLGGLATALARSRGPTAEALAELEAALEALPEGVREQRLTLTLHLAELATEAGDPQRAIALLEPLLGGDLRRSYAEVGAILGGALEAIGAHERACAVYRETARLRERQVADDARWRVRQLSVLLRVDELERREQQAVATAAGTSAALVRSNRERRLLEEQLRHSQRLEATGRLAAAVAHDFTNLLTVVLMCLDHRGERFLQDARAAAERGATLARSLLTIGRRAPLTLEEIEPAGAVRDAALLVARMRPDVTVDVDAAAASRAVVADPTLLDQVVMNLCMNAMDAMPSGGPLSVRVADRDRGGALGVRIEVEDTGTGIDPELLERIFEPFFTTRPAGIGTGLGLSIVRGIVYQLGGTIDVRSTVGVGSCFGVWLPAAPSPAPSG